MIQNKRTFRQLSASEQDKTVIIHVEGKSMEVPAGTTVAAALLNHDDGHFCHSAAAGDKRAPYCLMGVCFECLCEINGIPNQQACLTQVADGMMVRRQQEIAEPK